MARGPPYVYGANLFYTGRAGKSMHKLHGRPGIYKAHKQQINSHLPASHAPKSGVTVSAESILLLLHHSVLFLKGFLGPACANLTPRNVGLFRHLSPTVPRGLPLQMPRQMP
jgi:hypothetical protein